jgi:hypothetical protein
VSKNRYKASRTKEKLTKQLQNYTWNFSHLTAMNSFRKAVSVSKVRKGCKL